MVAPFEMLEDTEGQARFCFAHVDKEFTTGVLLLKPDAELPKHYRPKAFENLLQVAGHSQVTLLNEAGDVEATYDLTPGTVLRMRKGQWHIHANPFDEPSVTQFKAEGDITEIVTGMRHKYNTVNLGEAPKQA